MKKQVVLISAAAAAAAGVVIALRGKGGDSASAKAKPAKSGGKKAGFTFKNLQTGEYSFASGFRDAKTVYVRLGYDADNSSFSVTSEDFLAPTGDSHAAIVYAPDFALQIEYAAYYAGEDFAAMSKDTAERYKGFKEISCNGLGGIGFFNGKNYCMAFPAADAAADYVLFTVVNMGDDKEEVIAALPEHPMLSAMLDTLTITAE